ncbi:MAG: alpha/beta hydrolase [Ornithinimicrobium sp.]
MAQTPGSRRGWWRIGLGALWLGVAVWSWATRAGVLIAGHPAHAVTLVACAIAGIVLVAYGRRDLRSPTRFKKRRTWVLIVIRASAVLLSVAVLGAMIYLRPFSASQEAIDAMDGSAEVTVSDAPTTITLAGTSSGSASGTGLIFQPGARVDPRAYVPILSGLASQGYEVTIVKQPFGIGFAAVNAPARIIEEQKSITHWAVGGHSLGGVAASSYAESDPEQVRALLLWASYPLGSLADTNLTVTSVSGSEDGLAVPSDIDASKPDLPADATFVEVEGATHAFFGDYGDQPGDGMPTISRAEAQQQIVDASAELLAGLDPR